MSSRPGSRLLAAAVLGATALAPGRAGAQHAAPHASPLPATILESYAKASAIIDAAVAAHGGVEALRGARQLRLLAEGVEYHRHQSRRVAPPLDSTVYRADVMIDLARGRIVFTDTRGYVGGFSYTTRTMIDGERELTADVRNHTYRSRQTAAPTNGHGSLFLLPQLRLLDAVESTRLGQRRYVGRVRTVGGLTVDAVTFVGANGFAQTYGFDPVTRQLRALLSVGADYLAGDEPVETELLDYRMLNGVLLPTRWRTYRGPVLQHEYRYTAATPNYTIPDSALVVPAHFTASAAATSPEPVRALAPGVWAVHAGGVYSLAVAFDDHLLVVDAPLAGARDVLARLATLAPGKPVRWVVPTHHHSDHFGGVRHYAAAGATTVTTPGNLKLFRRAVTFTPNTVSPAGSQGVPTPSARVESVTGRRRVFTDGTRTVEIHDVGPNAHAEEMLVAWLPAEGILFQADLIEAPPSGVALRGNNATATVQLADYVRRQGWTVRTVLGAHSSLASPAELETLARQPILPP